MWELNTEERISLSLPQARQEIDWHSHSFCKEASHSKAPVERAFLPQTLVLLFGSTYLAPGKAIDLSQLTHNVAHSSVECQRMWWKISPKVYDGSCSIWNFEWNKLWVNRNCGIKNNLQNRRTATHTHTHTHTHKTSRADRDLFSC